MLAGEGAGCDRPLIGHHNHFTRGKGKRDAIVLLDLLPLLSHLSTPLSRLIFPDVTGIICKNCASGQNEVHSPTSHQHLVDRATTRCPSLQDTNTPSAHHYAPTCRPRIAALAPVTEATSAPETMKTFLPQRRIRRPAVSATKTQENNKRLTASSNGLFPSHAASRRRCRHA
jgi:hypothetical protein